MKRIYKLVKTCIAVAAVFAVFHGSAQNLTVTGKVTAEDDPGGLPGVTVLVKGTTNGTITDLDGNYRISAPDDAVLSFSFVGYKAEEQSVNGRSVIDVRLTLDQTALEEVVVVGYGEINRRDLTGSVVSVKADEIAQATPVSALEGMRGRLSGVQITANGSPGEAADIKIRGTSTLNSGTGPLYVVDGQQMDDIENINPTDIASVEVLKDGSSAAIYGSKSANGVIIITTKKGESGATKISSNYVRSYSSLATKIPVSNTRQAYQYFIARQGGLDDPDEVPTPADSLSQQFNQDYDYQEIITQVGIRDQVSLSLSGGKEDANFYWNNAFLDQEGIVKNSYYQRFNSTINVNFKVANRIKAGTRIIGSYSERNGLNEGAVFGQLSTHFPFLPVQDADGTYVGQTSSQQNVLAETIFTVRRRKDYDGQIFNYAEVDILPGLKFKSTMGILLELKRDFDFNPRIVQRGGSAPTGSERTALNFSLQQENYLSWNKKFGDHKVSALLGNQIQKWNNEFGRYDSEFNNDLIRTFSNVDPETFTGTTTATSHALVSQYARATYDYKGKYLFNATIRRDGSSRFGKENQYGIFPAASVGWRLSDEVFMKPFRSVLSDLKLRAGVSSNGNERIGNFDSRSLYQPGYQYNGVNGIALYQLGNANLVWEETSQVNYGLDAGLFDGKLNITVDMYRKVTKDLLYDTPIPEETGFGSIVNNIGEIENTGIELFISGNPITKGPVQWFTSFNIATNQNKILDLAEEDGQFITDRYIYKEGGSIGDFYGYTVIDVFPYDESNAFTDDGTQLTPVFDEGGGFLEYHLNGQTYTGNINQKTFQGQVLGGGNVNWKDHNGDFDIDPNNDRSVIGSGVPKFFGGFYNEFTHKGIKLSFLFDYNFGLDLYRQYDETRNQRMARTVQPGPDRIEQAWYKPGDNSFYPKLSPDAKNNVVSNTYWIDDADFIKLRSVRIDYKIPQRLLDNIGVVKNASVYASGNNLLTWTNYDGYNPELGSRGNALRPGLDNLRYPLYREYILGLNVTF